MKNDFYVSRSSERAKKRRTNLILNSLIGVIVLFIVVVGVTLAFGGGGDDGASQATSPAPDTETGTGNDDGGDSSNDSNDTNEETSDEETSASEEDTRSDSNAEEENTKNSIDENSEEQDDNSNEKAESISARDGVVVENVTDDPNVVRTYKDDSWGPVPTSQTGEHTNNFDDTSKDWSEKIQAVSYATGIPTESMVTWWMEGGGPSQAVATVSDETKTTAYRVYLEWIDRQGWKPTRVEELKENDKK
ncbi:YrrS family protein [Bacillus fonticola]|uniref:YrrS family protein n=1 Tax=Bacillus fonticola TaxID=2728853 RepID=UPI001472762E|nr:YrrS family protein [Bacillus fonticola]